MTEIERDHPRSPHFLIGHSHGGSIIAYWIKQAPRNAERIAGAAFLSTPFVAVQPARHAVKLARELAMQGVWMFPLLGFLAGWLVAVAAVCLASWMFGWSIDSTGRERVVAGAAVCAAAAGLICYRRMRRLLKIYSSRKGLFLIRATLIKF